MKKTKQKRASVPTVRRELHRHPHYFLVLFSFVFLGAMAAFLLVLSNVTMKQNQDLRQKAVGDALPDLVISALSAEKYTNAISDPVVLRVTVKNQGNTATTRSFTVALGFGQEVAYSENFFTTAPGRISFTIDSPLGPGEERTFSHTIPAGSVTPGNYAIFAAPDPRYKNVIQERNETDQAYTQSGFAVVSQVTQAPTQSSPSHAANTSPSVAPSTSDNLKFINPSSPVFFQTNDNAEIKITDIMSGESYKIRQTVQVQNDIKNDNSTDARSVSVQFRANDSAVSSKNFAMSQLHKTSDGIELVFETSFVGKTSNEFKTTLDTADSVAETNENDNVLTTTYSYQTTTTTVSASTIAAICNKYCANDGECSYGLKCSWNKCRHPDNLENERCAPASSVIAGCNLSCSSNRDCAAGLTCSSGKCRNPKATGSDTCQVSSATTVVSTKIAEKTTTTGQKSTTVSPTPTSTPNPSTPAGTIETPTPTIDTSTPTPTPMPVDEIDTTNTSEPTVVSDILGWLTELPTVILEQSNEVPKVVLGWFGIQEADNSTNLWFWLIGGGVVLILLILFFSFLGSRKKSSLATMKSPKTTTRPTPASSPQSYHAVATGAVVATAAEIDPNKADPSMMVAPKPLPAAAAANAAASPPSPTTGSTMVTKLQDRGVIKPSSTSPTSASTPPTTPPHTPS